MARGETAIISLEEAGRRFEEWPHNRGGKGRIPAKLCSVAIEVAGIKGLIEPPGSCMWRGTI